MSRFNLFRTKSKKVADDLAEQLKNVRNESQVKEQVINNLHGRLDKANKKNRLKNKMLALGVPTTAVTGYVLGSKDKEANMKRKMGGLPVYAEEDLNRVIEKMAEGNDRLKRFIYHAKSLGPKIKNVIGSRKSLATGMGILGTAGAVSGYKNAQQELQQPKPVVAGEDDNSLDKRASLIKRIKENAATRGEVDKVDSVKAQKIERLQKEASINNIKLKSILNNISAIEAK